MNLAASIAQIWALTQKDLKILLRDRTGMIVLFAMPIMFILVMSVALQGMFDVGSADHPVKLLVVNLDQGALYLNQEEMHLGQAIVDALDGFDGLDIVTEIDGQPLTRERAEALIADGTYAMALVLPPDLTQQVIDAVSGSAPPAPITVTFITDPGASSQLTAPVLAASAATMNRTVAYAQAPYRIRLALEHAAAELPPEQRAWIAPIANALIAELTTTYNLGDIGGESEIRIETEAPASFQVEQLPTAVEQNVPGYAIFGVFFIVGVLASSILNEKETGTFRRLMAAPLPRSVLLLGKLLPYYLVNVIQVALMFAIGRLVFGMNLGHSPAAWLMITLATAATATGLGLLVAALGKTESQISGIATLLALTLAAIGGMMVPTFAMPPFMQQLAKISPHYWALQGYQDVIVRGLGWQAVLPETGVLLAFAATFYAFAVWKFRFE